MEIINWFLENRKLIIDITQAISDNLFKETFTDDEKEILEKLIYSSKQRKFEVDDAFGIFIGFHITVTEAEKALPSSDFRELIKNKVKQEVEKRIEHI